MSQADGNKLPKFPSGTFLAGRALYATQDPLEGLLEGLAREGAERLLLLAKAAGSPMNIHIARE